MWAMVSFPICEPHLFDIRHAITVMFPAQDKEPDYFSFQPRFDVHWYEWQKSLQWSPVPCLHVSHLVLSVEVACQSPNVHPPTAVFKKHLVEPAVRGMHVESDPTTHASGFSVVHKAVTSLLGV